MSSEVAAPSTSDVESFELSPDTDVAKPISAESDSVLDDAEYENLPAELAGWCIATVALYNKNPHVLLSENPDEAASALRWQAAESAARTNPPEVEDDIARIEQIDLRVANHLETAQVGILEWFDQYDSKQEAFASIGVDDISVWDKPSEFFTATCQLAG